MSAPATARCRPPRCRRQNNSPAFDRRFSKLACGFAHLSLRRNRKRASKTKSFEKHPFRRGDDHAPTPAPVAHARRVRFAWDHCRRSTIRRAPLSAAAPLAVDVRACFSGPKGAKITPCYRGFDQGQTLELPVTLGFRPGYSYRFALFDVDGLPPSGLLSHAGSARHFGARPEIAVQRRFSRPRSCSHAGRAAARRYQHIHQKSRDTGAPRSGVPGRDQAG